MKRFIAIAALLLCGVGMVFAGGKQAGDEKVKVTMWSANRGQSTYWDPLIPVYNAKNTDNIEFQEIRYFGDDFYQAVELTVQTGGELPDLFSNQVLYCFSGTMNQQGWFLNLDEWLKTHTTAADQEFQRIYSPYKIAGSTVRDGEWLSAGHTGSPGNRLIYNRDIFAKAGLPDRAPETLEEMIEFARQITTRLKGEGIYGFAMNMKNPNSAYGRSLAPQISLYTGLEYTGYNPETGKFQADTEERWEILRAWQQLLAPDTVFPGSESLDIDPLRAQFADGKIGMYISYGFEPMVYAETAQFPNKYNWSMAKIPVPGGKYKGKISTTVDGAIVINGKSKQVEEAWKVYRDVFYSLDNVAGLVTLGLATVVVPEINAIATLPDIYTRIPYANWQPDADCYAGLPYFTGSYTLEGPDVNAVHDQIIQGGLGRTEALALLKDMSERYQRGMQLAIDRGEYNVHLLNNYDPTDLTKYTLGAEIPKSR
ncbi:MAG: extracellular solute-binding protein [Treponema sp.]|jgi:multiple sugar transport system substrate-binding protein|nr:extracellular solute-binding protein [Treponema sp.]